MADIRRSTNPAVRSAAQWLARVNGRHPWSHNEHFHGWILRNLPARRRTALDVGCGTGVLAGKLAARFERVIGIDADAGMAAAAGERFAGDPRVSIGRQRFDAFPAGTDEGGEGGIDLVTMVAVLHHLDLDDALARVARLLAPGGRLLVVGLAKVDSKADFAVDIASAVANPIMGMIKHPRPVRPGEEAGETSSRPLMPVRDPAETLAEIAAAAGALLPGASVRRRLFFRYSLRWDKPGG
ncbi:class I SAM-dependent methyltransferase [Actinospica sp. MGRD01-02]|uniref:Class I SAM-dependent methyltransferase n=1 Tax=Actinospica acidithermotolerans TaxID=2828514 RepID=A0A941EB58_9ACTN|nr:class I SAM-dependent methyltransferase [Actinospica acidithermotolerans]MBR7828017.1 class I SAM-dependent methyltransferase [Actinospica acidithermotolerans]